ncbi:glycosyltransferase [Sphingomonas sp. ASY06-1R]|uniref:glycosyltransferase n=1 Tax=Sphingomonas sp. ASY06-1R TaxID=3445771 RepID=UPI003FA1CE67
MLHVVLTRFNIASPGREAPIRNSPGWLDRRFELFERYCLPSVASQSIDNFAWIIYFDHNTPERFRKRITSAQSEFNFTARYVEYFDGNMAPADVNALDQPSNGLVVTTRLDNDDAIARNFLARVQEAATLATDGTVLNFTNGLALREGRLYTAVDFSNPFTSLVERGSGPARTIWAAKHHELHQRWNIQQVGGAPAWLQVVHGENVTNRIKGRRLSDTNLINSFKLADDVALEPVSRLGLVRENVILGPTRSLRERLVKFVKPVAKKLMARE